MRNISLSNFTDITLDEFKPEVRRKLKNDFWNIFDVSTNWSNKLMLGTDHPFLPRDNIVELFECLFCSDLSEELQPSMIQNILGENLIDILPVNAHLTPSYRVADSEGLEKGARFEKRIAQIEYYIDLIDKKGLGTGPVQRKKRNAELFFENENRSEALETIEKGLKIAKKGYTLARMIEEGKKDSDIGERDEYLDKALKAADKGRYSEGMSILKKR